MPTTTTRAYRAVQPAERQNWAPPQRKDTFTADELIEAFSIGHRTGQDHQDRVLREKLKENLVAALAAAEAFIQRLVGDYHVASRSAFLRIDSVTDFSVLILVEEEQYVADSILNIYRAAVDEERKMRTPTFSVRFSFAPLTDQTDETAIFADGYNFRYAGEQTETP